MTIFLLGPGFVPGFLLYGLCASQLRFVIAGLDPAIHDEAQPTLTVSMDARAGKLAQPA
jgi:hypothetical protein